MMVATLDVLPCFHWYEVISVDLALEQAYWSGPHTESFG